jgi:hypothetical protein
MAFIARSVVVLFLATLSCTQEGEAARLARSLEQDFSQHLSNGAPKTAVVAFLRQHGILYTETPRRKRIDGLIREVEKDAFGWGSVQLHFFFDDDDKLTKHEISPIYTGL